MIDDSDAPLSQKTMITITANVFLNKLFEYPIKDHRTFLAAEECKSAIYRLLPLIK